MDKSDLRRITKQILIQEQKQILTENIACHVTDNPCKVGNCLFDPGTNSMCCVKDIAYGCIDGKVAKDDRRKTKGLGGGSGFKKPQGGSARLEKFNSRQKLKHAKEAKKFKMRESEIRRVIRRVINEAAPTGTLVNYARACTGSSTIGPNCWENPTGNPIQVGDVLKITGGGPNWALGRSFFAKEVGGSCNSIYINADVGTTCPKCCQSWGWGGAGNQTPSGACVAACPPGQPYECVNGTCIQDNNGQYPDLQTCVQNCTSTVGQDQCQCCSGGGAISMNGLVPAGTCSSYNSNTLSNCQVSPPQGSINCGGNFGAGWFCLPPGGGGQGSCQYTPSMTIGPNGPFATEQDCETSNYCGGSTGVDCTQHGVDNVDQTTGANPGGYFDPQGANAIANGNCNPIQNKINQGCPPNWSQEKCDCRMDHLNFLLTLCQSNSGNVTPSSTFTNSMTNHYNNQGCYGNQGSQSSPHPNSVCGKKISICPGSTPMTQAKCNWLTTFTTNNNCNC